MIFDSRSVAEKMKAGVVAELSKGLKNHEELRSKIEEQSDKHALETYCSKHPAKRYTLTYSPRKVSSKSATCVSRLEVDLGATRQLLQWQLQGAQ